MAGLTDDERAEIDTWLAEPWRMNGDSYWSVQVKRVLLAEVRRLREDSARLRADLRAAAERIGRQSELPSKRAEKAPGTAQETLGGGGEGCGP